MKPYVDMLEKHSMGLMEEVRRSEIEKIGEFARTLSLWFFILMVCVCDVDTTW